MSKKTYNQDSISALKGADRVRKRPAVIFGSDGLKGCKHSVFEILSNSIDESREGHGDLIEVIRHEDKSITIKDNGRGIPLDYNESEGRYNWELVYCELYAGGKYDNNTGENYSFSLGLNGLGACATQYSSEYMNVIVFRDGYKYEIGFKKGQVDNHGLKKTKCDYESTGTIQHWKPDLDVFTDIDIPLDYFQDVMKKQSVVNKGVKFILIDEASDERFEYYYENGIVDYLEEINNGQNITPVEFYKSSGKGRDRKDKDDYNVKVEVAFAFNNHVNMIEYYHNSSFLEHGGSPDRAVKTAFAYAFHKFAKKLGKYKKNEKKITFKDIEDSLVLITNSFSTVTSYENQTKKAITNKFIREFMTEFLKKKLEIYIIENKMESEKALNQILVNKRSREKAEKTRLRIRKKLSGSVTMTNRVKKFIDCKSKDIDNRELYILEGDSALGACKLARDAKFQALMPVRGKILNCLKADYNRIFKNDIITDLLKVLGCGVEINSKHNKDLSTFDLDELNWNKIIICTDADVDGFHIRTMILTMLYRLVPTLIEEGKVYIAESPLYEINEPGKTHFAYSEREKNNIVKKIDGKYSLQRSKGLGENDPDMMWHTTMNPKTRKLIKILPEGLDETEEMFEIFLGKDVNKRKKFIASKGMEYMELIDIS